MGRERELMRKLDILRKIVRKQVKKESDIYKLDVRFMAKKGYHNYPGSHPTALPLGGEKGELIGVAIEYPYEDENGQVFTYTEYFEFGISEKVKRDV